MRSALLCVLVWANLSHSQDAPEPFTFAPEARTNRPPVPTWWCVAVAPDGQTILTSHQRQDAGEIWVWDAGRGQVVATLHEPHGVRSVAFSPQGDLFATANFDHTVRVYATKTRTLLAQSSQKNLGHTAGVNSIAFSSDGTRLASAGLDRRILIWDLATLPRDGGSVTTMTPRNILDGHEDGVLCVAFSPENTHLLSGSLDKTARVWRMPEQAGKVVTKEQRQLQPSTAVVESVAWSPDGTRLATGSWDATAKLWEPDGKLVATLRGHTRGVLALAFSPDSQTLVTTSGDQTTPAAGEVRVWNAGRGTDIGNIGKHDDMIRSVAFGASNRIVFTVGRDRALRVWNIATKLEERTLRASEDTAPIGPIITALAYSPDGKTLAVADDDGTIRLQARTSRTVHTQWTAHRNTIHRLVWLGNTHLVSASNDRMVCVWDVATKQAQHSWLHPGVVYAIAVAPDGKTIATGGFDKTIRLYDRTTGKQLSERVGHTASVRTLAFAPSGTVFASGSSDFTIRVWQTAKDTPAAELRGHTRAVRVIGFLNESTLVSGSDDRTVKLWNTLDGECTPTTAALADAVSSLTIGPKGSYFVVGMANGALQQHEATDGAQRAVLLGCTDGVAAATVAPDGMELAAGGYDRALRFWSAVTNQVPHHLAYRGHRGAVWGVAIHPDGKQVGTAGQDGTLRLWDAANGQELHQWDAHGGGVHDIAWSRDGKWLLTGGADKTAKLWNATTRQLVQTYHAASAVRCVAIAHDGSALTVGTAENHLAVYTPAQTKPVTTLALDSPCKRMQFLGTDYVLTISANGQAHYWHIHEGRVLRQLESGRISHVRCVGGSQDGTYLLVAGREHPSTVAGSNRLRTEDVATLIFDSAQAVQPTVNIQRGADEITHIASSDQGNFFVATLADGQVVQWENNGLGRNPTQVRRYYAHAARIHGLAVSADGEFVVTVAADGTARRWPGARGAALVYVAKLRDEVKQTWFARSSPDGRWLVTGGDDHVVRVRSALPGKYRELTVEEPTVYCTALTPDGSTLVSGHHNGVLRVWDVKTGTSLRKLDEHNHRIWAMAFTADGTRLVSVGGDWDGANPGEIRIWDTTTWKPLLKLAGHTDLIYSVAIAPDGKTFATGSRDRHICRWEIATGKQLEQYQSHTAGVRTLVYGHNGQTIISGGHDRRVVVRDVAGQKDRQFRLFDGTGLEKMRLAPDGKSLALSIRTGPSQGHIIIWDHLNDRILHEFKAFAGQVNDVVFSPDGQMLAGVGGYFSTAEPSLERGAVGPYVIAKAGTTGTQPTAEIKIFDLRVGRILLELPGHRRWIETAQFTPDGKQFITAGGAHDKPGEIRLWDTAGFRPTLTLIGHKSPVMCAAFNPDGTRLVTGGTNQVLVWDMTQRPPTFRECAGHEGFVRQVVFGPDGQRFYSAGEDGIVRIWKHSGELVQAFSASTLPIYGMDLHADGTRLALATGDWRKKQAGIVAVWDTKKVAEVFRLPQANPVWSVAWLGNQLVVGQQGKQPITVYDHATKKHVRSLDFADDVQGVRTVAKQPWLIGVGGQTGTLKIWDQRTWREAYEVPAHPGKVCFMVDVTADGQSILSAGGDAAVLWQFPPAPKAPSPKP